MCRVDEHTLQASVGRLDVRVINPGGQEGALAGAVVVEGETRYLPAVVRECWGW